VGKNFAVLDIFLFGIFININCARWDNAPQAHSRVSNINVDIYKYPMKNISKTAKFLPMHYPT
jgi:hypothetical protein